MKQVFIMMVGFSKSGKSTLAEKLQEYFQGQFIRVNSDSIHRFLNTTYPIFQDDDTVEGSSYQLRQKTTKSIQGALIDVLLRNSNSVILDTANLTQYKRKEIFVRVKAVNKNIATVIVYVNFSEEELYERLHEADQQKVVNGEKPAWVDLYEKAQRGKLEEPQRSEADYFFMYPQQRSEDIMASLKGIA